MKILLVDDHALFRAGLRMLLGMLSSEVEIVEAATADEALQAIAADPLFEVCLLDLALKGGHTSLALLGRFKEVVPALPVVVVSAAEDAATVRACISAGAMSFIPKSLGPDVLTLALQHVVAGRVYLPDSVQEGLDDLKAAPTLTPRQHDVLRQLARGLPTKLIARELALSEHTVKEHITAVFQALGAHNRTDAVIKGSRWRLIDGAPS